MLCKNGTCTCNCTCTPPVIKGKEINSLCSVTRVTSVNRIQLGGGVDAGSGGVGGSTSSGYNGEQCVIQLIPHLNLDASRLQQILQGLYL